jgi:hypothetical protein
MKQVDHKQTLTNFQSKVIPSPAMIGNQSTDAVACNITSINKDTPEMEKDKWSMPQCVVCMDGSRSEILSPCLHFVSCKACVVRIAAQSSVLVCPICRTAVRSIVSVSCKQPPTNATCSFIGTQLVADAICHVNQWTSNHPWTPEQP